MLRIDSILEDSIEELTDLRFVRGGDDDNDNDDDDEIGQSPLNNAK